MILPPLPTFDSRELPSGRLYQVHDRTHCAAYAIDDPLTFRALGAIDGLIAYAFVEVDRAGVAKRLGTWYAVFHPDDLLEALETARAGLDPDAPRPQHRKLSELIDERLAPRDVLRIDVDVDRRD